MSFLFGRPGGFEQQQKFTPQQQQSLQQMLGGATGQLPMLFQYLQNILSQDPEAMRAFEAPAMRQFEEQTVPGIAERFTGMGAQRSSAFGQQLGQAGARLQEQLAAQRAGLQEGAGQQLQQLLQRGLTPQYETMYRPETYGLMGELLGGLGGGIAPGLGQSLGRLLGFGG